MHTFMKHLRNHNDSAEQIQEKYLVISLWNTELKSEQINPAFADHNMGVEVEMISTSASSSSS